MGTRYDITGNVPRGQVVVPAAPRGGGPSQPRFTRGNSANQQSSKLKTFQSCVGSEMSGKSGNRKEIQTAFKAAAGKCKGGA